MTLAPRSGKNGPRASQAPRQTGCDDFKTRTSSTLYPSDSLFITTPAQNKLRTRKWEAFIVATAAAGLQVVTLEKFRGPRKD